MTVWGNSAWEKIELQSEYDIAAKKTFEKKDMNWKPRIQSVYMQ